MKLKYDKAAYFHAANTNNRDLSSNWPEIPARQQKDHDYFAVIVNGEEVYKSSRQSCEKFCLVNEGVVVHVTDSVDEQVREREKRQKEKWESILFRP